MLQAGTTIPLLMLLVEGMICCSELYSACIAFPTCPIPCDCVRKHELEPVSIIAGHSPSTHQGPPSIPSNAFDLRRHHGPLQRSTGPRQLQGLERCRIAKVLLADSGGQPNLKGRHLHNIYSVLQQPTANVEPATYCASLFTLHTVLGQTQRPPRAGHTTPTLSRSSHQPDQLSRLLYT